MKKGISYYFITMILLVSLSMFSQGRKPPQPKPDAPPPPHPELPIDKGLAYLFITGIIYGVYQSTRNNFNETS